MSVKAFLRLERLEGDRSLIDRVRPGGCCQRKAGMISEMFRAFGHRQPRDKCCERMHVPHLGLGNTRLLPWADVRIGRRCARICEPGGPMGNQQSSCGPTQDASQKDRKLGGRQKCREREKVLPRAPARPGRCLA